jgi:hypothetical protein
MIRNERVVEDSMDTDMYLDWKVEDMGIQRLKGGRWKSNFLIIEHGSGRLDEKKSIQEILPLYY